MKILKKTVSLFLCSVFALSLIGCTGADHDELAQEDEPAQEEVKPTGTFIECDRGLTWHIAYHRDSKVMYVIGGGTFTMLVNQDGTPMLWNGE